MSTESSDLTSWIKVAVDPMSHLREKVGREGERGGEEAETG